MNKVAVTPFIPLCLPFPRLNYANEKPKVKPTEEKHPSSPPATSYPRNNLN